MIRRPPRSTRVRSSAASDVYKRQVFDNAGQDCCARSRILVQRNVYDHFMELFETAVAGVQVRDPRDEASEMGPLISADQKARVAAFVDEADVAFRGSTPGGAGFWYAPTVVTPK